MALFIEPFSFASASSHPSSHYAPPISPMSAPTSAYGLPASFQQRRSHAVSDLAFQFSQHNISEPSRDQRLDSAISATSDASPTQSSYSYTTESYSPPPRSWTPPGSRSYRRLSASAIRAQRQTNVRLLAANSSHVEQLAALVERMVDEGAQCRVCCATAGGLRATASAPSSTRTSPSPSVDDEGVDGMDLVATSSLPDDEEDVEEGSSSYTSSPPLHALRFRRSGELASGSAHATCVRKDIKVRKPRRQRSSR